MKLKEKQEKEKCNLVLLLCVGQQLSTKVPSRKSADLDKGNKINMQ